MFKFIWVDGWLGHLERGRDLDGRRRPPEGGGGGPGHGARAHAGEAGGRRFLDQVLESHTVFPPTTIFYIKKKTQQLCAQTGDN